MHYLVQYFKKVLENYKQLPVITEHTTVNTEIYKCSFVAEWSTVPGTMIW